MHDQAEPTAKIVGSIPPYAKGIKTTGETAMVGKEIWAPVQYQGIAGWANQDYLYEESAGIGLAALPSSERKVASVTGQVTYREDLAIRPGAIVEVRLVDISRQDMAAIIVGEQIISRHAQVPIPFEVTYDPADIEPSHTYAIQARITDHGQLMFTTTDLHPVITHGNPTTVEVVLHPPARNAPGTPQ